MAGAARSGARRGDERRRKVAGSTKLDGPGCKEGMGQTPSRVSDEVLRIAWTSLLRTAVRFGVPPDDAKDLVQDAILKSLDVFDPARGEFLALATTAVGNLAKNYWRKNKNRWSETEPDALPEGDVLEGLWDEQERRLLLGEIMKELQPDEKAFLEVLGGLLEEAEGRAVAEAARTSGLTVEQGWNLMRKITRKAQKVRDGWEADAASTSHVDADLILPEKTAPLALPSAPSPEFFHARIASMKIAESGIMSLARLFFQENGFLAFLGKLSPEHREKLEVSLGGGLPPL
jgi:DNA-directed RNA polymerase specialized sigma24 family protein